MTERCPWTETLGAYLLGGLDDRERLGMRAHLDGCHHCSAELDELRPVARLLQSVDADRLREDVEPSPALRAAVVAEARRVERRHRWVRAGAFVAAAAVLLAVLGFVRTDDDRGPAGERIQLIGTAGAEGWVDVRSVRAGTYATFHMKGLPAGDVYRLWFQEPDGERVPLGTFRGVEGIWLECGTTTAAPADSFAAVGASDETGTTVLWASLPGGSGSEVSSASVAPTSGYPG